MAHFFGSLFGKSDLPKISPSPQEEEAQEIKQAAKERHAVSTRNLESTLQDLLDEGDRRRLRPIFVAGDASTMMESRR